MDEEITDSPQPWVERHIRRFVETGGHPRPGWNDLLLTTRGRLSGKLRRTVLVYATDGDRFVVAASHAGADRHPAWYLNLVADPAVRVQVGSLTRPALARVATAAQRPALWQMMIAMAPSYQEYQRRTAREIPLVIIDPVLPT